MSDTAPHRHSDTVFLNARLIDPASGQDEPGGLLVSDGVIADLGGASAPQTRRRRASVIDCKGQCSCPGLIDMQVFTGEPGQEHRETLKTASQAAAAGGVTTIVVMPDTEPVIDQVALVDFIQRRARDNAVVNVHVMAAMTQGPQGRGDDRDRPAASGPAPSPSPTARPASPTRASCATCCSTPRTSAP